MSDNPRIRRPFGHCIVCGYETPGFFCAEHLRDEMDRHKLRKNPHLIMPPSFRCNGCAAIVWERDRDTHECPPQPEWRQLNVASGERHP